MNFSQRVQAIAHTIDQLTTLYIQRDALSWDDAFNKAIEDMVHLDLPIEDIADAEDLIVESRERS